MSNKPAQLRHLSESLYQAARERHDCCGRCWYSALRQEGQTNRLICRKHGAAEVTQGGVCAEWHPEARKMVALR